MALPEYDELFSISDLHMGGEPGRQIFREGERLAAFARTLAARQGKVALVLAGDVFDTLPELDPGGMYVAVDGATAVRRVAGMFPAAFDGLAAFLRRPESELVLLIGNHDVEVGFPETQEALRVLLGGDDPAARGRIRFVTTGTGLRCTVGGVDVFVTHGNEADRWNHVDHEGLRKIAHARALGQAMDPALWTPNAGTRLVVDAMNPVKRRHPFIDLFKPETAGALRVLLAMYGAEVMAAPKAVDALLQRARQQMGPAAVLGGEVRVRNPDPLTDALLARSPRGRAEVRTIEATVDTFQRDGVDPLDLVVDGNATLGFLDFLVRPFTGRPREEVLVESLLEWVGDDKGWALDDRDETFREVMAQVSGSIRVVITGHTHLPRFIPPSYYGAVYLNAGAWARTIRLGRQELETLTQRAKVSLLQAFEASSLDVVDQCRIEVGGGSRLLVNDTIYAAFTNGDTTSLLSVDRDGGFQPAFDPDTGRVFTCDLWSAR